MMVSRQPSRRARLTDAQTAARVLDAAVATFAERGPVLGVEQVSFEKAIADADVSRASAYRRWPSRADFLADVLVAAAERTTLEPESDAEIEALVGLIDELGSSIQTPQGARNLMVEGLRLSAGADIVRLRASASYRTYLALCVAHAGLEDAAIRDRVGTALAATQRRFDERRAEIFAGLPALMGYRWSDPHSPGPARAMSEAASATMTGILLRSFPEPSALETRVERRAFGSDLVRAWSTPELQLVGTFLSHVEPDPSVVWDDARLAWAWEELQRRAGWARELR